VVLSLTEPKPMTIDARLQYAAVDQMYDLQFKAMGTDCRIRFTAVDKGQAVQLTRESVAWVARFESRYSRFRDDSLIAFVNKRAGDDWIEIDDEFESLLNLCDELMFLSEGVLDPTSLPLITLWDYRRKHQTLPSEAEVEAARALVGWQKVERRSGAVRLPTRGMSLDLGGFGKEYAVDQVAGIAVSLGIQNMMVDFGRDIRVMGAPPTRPAWHIALEDPQRPGQHWTSLALSNAGVASSGDYRRFFEYQGDRFGHILDPRNGRPVSNATLSVSVIASSCLEAGVLSTSAFVFGIEGGLRLIESGFGTEGCLVMENQTHQTSKFYEYVAQN